MEIERKNRIKLGSEKHDRRRKSGKENRRERIMSLFNIKFNKILITIVVLEDNFKIQKFFVFFLI